MKKAIITGSQGFVGKYLRQELETHGYEVIGLDIQSGDDTICVDLLDHKYVQHIVSKLSPTAIFHLAGQSNVSKSWALPQKTIELNVIASINLMESVRSSAPNCRIVMVGSSDEYGSLGEIGRAVSESVETHPQTPYAVSKKAQEEMAQIYVRSYGMNICMTRSFNHVGVGQSKGFLVPDFASGIVDVERGKASCLRVGNLSSRRDFTHIKDVVHAYRLISEKGQAGEIYNVGSGTTYSAQEILDKLRTLARCPIPVEEDPTKIRPSDTPIICCNHDKLTRHTGWIPEYQLEDALREVLDSWRHSPML